MSDDGGGPMTRALTPEESAELHKNAVPLVEILGEDVLLAMSGGFDNQTALARNMHLKGLEVSDDPEAERPVPPAGMIEQMARDGVDVAEIVGDVGSKDLPEIDGNLVYTSAADRAAIVEAAGLDNMAMDVHELTEEVIDERLRQMKKWSDCEHLPDGTGGAGRGTYETIAKNACNRAYREKRLTHAHVFEEEAMEVLNATDPLALRAELIQVMAVAAKWIADIDSRVTHMIHVGPTGSVFVKEVAFFRSQGGFKDGWGKNWIPVKADSIEDARKIGERGFPFTCRP